MSHPNIVQYLGSDYDEEKGSWYIFLEYVGGGSLASVLQGFGKVCEGGVGDVGSEGDRV